MNILLLTQVLPFPPDSGPKVKTYSLIRHLAQNHNLTLVSFTRGDQAEAIERLRPFCKEIHPVPIRRGYFRDGLALLASLVTQEPWLVTRDARKEMRSLVNQLINDQHFDAVHCDQLYMTQYAPKRTGLQRTFDAHNALWQLYRRLSETSPSRLFRTLYARDWPLLKAYEGKICREFDTVLAVSETDCSALQEAAGRDINSLIVPITVDAQKEPVFPRPMDNGHILHIGTMYWQPNIEGVEWFILRVFPLIRSQLTGIELDIVGANPPFGLTRFNDIDTGIHVTGYVEDVTPFLQTAGVFIVPLLAGSGMRVKILEALARGLPVVTTSIGCEGIQVRDREHVYIADDPGEFARAVITLLEDPLEAGRIGRNGRALIENQYDLRVALKSIDLIYPVNPASAAIQS